MPLRHIAHLDMDSFFVSVEQHRNSALKGKPLLIGSQHARGVVAACSYEARKYGIHQAMPMQVALRLCRHAIVLRGDADAYTKFSDLITDVVDDTVPMYEKAGIDEFYIDLTGMDRFYDCMQFTDALKQKIYKETGLPLTYGLAVNKLISKVAAGEVKPNGKIEIPMGSEQQFLAPLPIQKLPGIGEATRYKLLKMGVQTIKLLSDIPLVMLQNLLGAAGAELWHRAHGKDDTPVIPYKQQQSISTEITFQQDTIDMDRLHAELVRMTEQIAFELRTMQKLTGCITIKLRYSDHQTYTKQRSIPYTNADHKLLVWARQLFNELYERRLLIRMLGVKFTRLIPGSYQTNLFEDTSESIALYKAIDHLKHRFGEDKLKRAGGVVGSMAK